MNVYKSSQTTLTVELGVQDKHNTYDVCLFVPTAMPLKDLLGDEGNFYAKHIDFRHHYFSSQILLPLLKTQIGEMEQEKKNYRSNLSLFTYHFSRSVESEVMAITNLTDPEQQAERISMLCESTEEITYKLRRIRPKDQGHQHFYAQIDNYLSWTLEQEFLKLGYLLPKSKLLTASLKRIMSLAEEEQLHREEMAYNSTKTINDPVRLSNKMKLLKRVIETPVVIGEASTPNGVSVDKAIKAITTAFVMLGVLYITKFLQLSYEHLSLSFILILCGVYGIREIFRDELKRAIWRLYSRNRPKWTIYLTDNFTKKRIGRRLISLDYGYPCKLKQPELTQARRNHSNIQEQVVHLKVTSNYIRRNFNQNYLHHEDQLELDVEPLFKLCGGPSNRFFSINTDKIAQQRLEKRLTLNLVVGNSGTGQYQRYKLVINKNSIVSVDPVS